MRVLLDTSVWSLAFRKKQPAEHAAVTKLVQLLTAGEELFLTGMILQEILQAFRSDEAFRSVSRHLEAFPLLEMGRAEFTAAAALHRRCAARGVAASSADCQIAAAAIRHDCALLTADGDFVRIARLSDLRLV